MVIPKRIVKERGLTATIPLSVYEKIETAGVGNYFIKCDGTDALYRNLNGTADEIKGITFTNEKGGIVYYNESGVVEQKISYEPDEKVGATGIWRDGSTFDGKNVFYVYNKIGLKNIKYTLDVVDGMGEAYKDTVNYIVEESKVIELKSFTNLPKVGVEVISDGMVKPLFEYTKKENLVPNYSKIELISGKIGDGEKVKASGGTISFGNGTVSLNEKILLLNNLLPEVGKPLSIDVKLDDKNYTIKISYDNITSSGTTKNVHVYLLDDVEKAVINFKDIGLTIGRGNGIFANDSEKAGINKIYRSVSILKGSTESGFTNSNSIALEGSNIVIEHSVYFGSGYVSLTLSGLGDLHAGESLKFTARYCGDDSKYDSYEVIVEKPSSTERTMKLEPKQNEFLSHVGGGGTNLIYSNMFGGIVQAIGIDGQLFHHKYSKVAEFIENNTDYSNDLNYDSCLRTYKIDNSTEGTNVVGIYSGEGTSKNIPFEATLGSSKFKFTFYSGVTNGDMAIDVDKWNGEAITKEIIARLLFEDGTYYKDTITVNIPARTATTRTSTITINSLDEIENNIEYMVDEGKLKKGIVEVADTKVEGDLIYEYSIMKQVEALKDNDERALVDTNNGIATWNIIDGVTVSIKNVGEDGKTRFTFKTADKNNLKNLKGTYTFKVLDGMGKEYSDTVTFKVSEHEVGSATIKLTGQVTDSKVPILSENSILGKYAESVGKPVNFPPIIKAQESGTSLSTKIIYNKIEYGSGVEIEGLGKINVDLTNDRKLNLSLGFVPKKDIIFSIKVNKEVGDVTSTYGIYEITIQAADLSIEVSPKDLVLDFGKHIKGAKGIKKAQTKATVTLYDDTASIKSTELKMTNGDGEVEGFLEEENSPSKRISVTKLEAVKGNSTANEGKTIYSPILNGEIDLKGSEEVGNYSGNAILELILE